MNSRNDEVRRALLWWLAREQRRQPNPGEFVDSSDAMVNGRRATLDETLAADRNLAAHLLVTGVPVNEFEYPVRPQLTDTSGIVVDDYDCDVARWLRSRVGGYSDQSVHVSNAGHVAVNSTSVVESGDVTEKVPNIEALVSATHAVQSLLPQLGITDDEAIQARNAPADILSGPEDDVADHGRLKAARGRLVSILSPATAAAVSTALGDGLIQTLNLPGI
ncbi:MAG TPA: hypothetical protein VMW80_00885 [Candidatus Dormibacteraeota bacterium]|nr:hypothetical protein [Candidatus Dormibacteraeota bacterium]